MHDFPKLLGTILTAALLQACASTTPQLDTHFGDAVRTAKLQQTLNPDAGRQPSSVDGIEGTPAHDTMGRYYESFRAPPPTFEILFSSGGR